MDILTTKSTFGWKYTTTTFLAVFAGAFITLIEVLFVRSWSSSRSMYFPPLVSAVATVCLFVSAVLSRLEHFVVPYLSMAGSGVLVLMSMCFFVEITPIAQGNNDSGEIFWFVAFPTILLFVYLCRIYLKFKQVRS